MGHVWRGGDMAFSYTDQGDENNSFSVSEKIVKFFGLDKLANQLNLSAVSKRIADIKENNNQQNNQDRKNELVA